MEKNFRQSLAEAVRAHNTAAHRVTNVAPSDLMYSRKLRRSLPLASSAKFLVNDEVIRNRDWEVKQRAKEMEDKKRGAREGRIMVGDQVVLRRSVKRKGDSSYDPEELQVTKKRKGDLTLTARDGRTIRRHITLAKKIVQKTNSKPIGSHSSVITPPTGTSTARVLRPRETIKAPQKFVNNLEE